MGKNNVQKNNLDDIDAMLCTLTANLDEAKRMLNSGKIDPGRVKNLTGYVVEIRLLLKELEQSPYSSARITSRLSVINELRKGYLELEGMVKEFRNDLC
ncbi:MAG: hypothetical protein ACM34I_05880 [bacterium]